MKTTANLLNHGLVLLILCGTIASAASAAAQEVAPYQPIGPIDVNTNNAEFYGRRLMPMMPQSVSTLQIPPPATNSFQALPDNNRSIPPDTHGAVGPNHVMTMLNTEVRIQNRSGGILSTMTLSNFWKSTNIASFSRVFDPRVIYDPYAERWIAAAMVDPNTTNSRVLIGVSLTGDATGSWNVREVKADTNNPATVWADQPRLGLNKDWIVVQANMFTNSSGVFSRSHFYVFNKTNLYAGNFSTPTRFVNTDGAGSEIPAVTYDNSLTVLYLVQNASGYVRQANATSTNYLAYLRLFSISGQIGSETLNYVTDRKYFVLTNDWTWDFFPPTSNFGQQKGTTNRIDLRDSRMQNLVYRNGYLWCAQTAFLPAGGSPTHSAVQWWKLNPTDQKIEPTRGRIEDTSGVISYAYPSIAVNRFNDVLVGYSRFSSNQYASAEFYFQPFAPSKESSVQWLLKDGEGPYIKSGGNINRWGDYSATVIDPSNDISFWTIQEYAAANVNTGLNDGDGRWGTWWGSIAPTVSANDNFSNAQTVSGVLATNIGLFIRPTRESGEPNHFANSNLCSIWFRWTASVGGLVNLNAGGNYFAPGLVVYTGSSISALTRVADSKSGGTVTSGEAHPGITTTPPVAFQASAGTTYQIALVDPANMVGDYTVILNQPTAPIFTSQPAPAATNVIQGNNVTFSAFAIGSPNPTFQWRFNGTNISGATSTNYTVTNVQSSNEGNFSMVASNSSGSTTSSNAFLKYFPTASTPMVDPIYTNNSFQLTINIVPGYNYIIQASTNLTDWTSIFTNVVPFTFTDTNATNYLFRFYRSQFVP